MFSYVKWTSCRQHTVGSFYPTRQSLSLTRVFRRFTFNGIVDTYGFFLHALSTNPPQYSAVEVPGNSVFSNSIFVSSNKILYLWSLSPWFMIQRRLQTDSWGDYLAHLVCFHSLREHSPVLPVGKYPTTVSSYILSSFLVSGERVNLVPIIQSWLEWKSPSKSFKINKLAEEILTYMLWNACYKMI